MWRLCMKNKSEKEFKRKTGIVTGFLLSSGEEVIKGTAESFRFLFISKIQADLARLKSTQHSLLQYMRSVLGIETHAGGK